MKQDVNPVMIAAAVIVLLVLVVFIARKNLGSPGSGSNPYNSPNAPKGTIPGHPPPGSPDSSGPAAR